MVRLPSGFQHFRLVLTGKASDALMFVARIVIIQLHAVSTGGPRNVALDRQYWLSWRPCTVRVLPSFVPWQRLCYLHFSTGTSAISVMSRSDSEVVGGRSTKGHCHPLLTSCTPPGQLLQVPVVALCNCHQGVTDCSTLRGQWPNTGTLSILSEVGHALRRRASEPASLYPSGIGSDSQKRHLQAYQPTHVVKSTY